MTLFMMLTLLHVPTMQVYDKYEFFKDEGHSFIEMLSLGNMGFSKTECVIQHMQSNTTTLKCAAGQITTLIDFGITTHTED